jgi:hypothetical protein
MLFAATPRTTSADFRFSVLRQSGISSSSRNLGATGTESSDLQVPGDGGFWNPESGIPVWSPAQSNPAPGCPRFV